MCSEATDTYTKEVFGSGVYRPQVCQEASLEGSGQAQQAPWILCFNHRNVMTVPFFPICQASKGMKRIHILQEAEKKKKVNSLANSSSAKVPGRHAKVRAQASPHQPIGYFTSLPTPANDPCTETVRCMMMAGHRPRTDINVLW